jgi:hypothetical protein
MKYYLSLLLISGFLSIVQAQEISDAIRYSQDNLNGTARFRAMSGAFGALGGDLSSINVNPAGSAVFSNNQTTVTLTNYSTKNQSDYFGGKMSEKENSFDLNQAGGIFVFKNNNKNSDWSKFAIAINYENTNNFDNSIVAVGTNPRNSIANYFLSYANGIPLNVIKYEKYSDLGHGEQQAYLGYQGYVINPTKNNDSNTNYSSNVREGGNYYHENNVYTSGYNGKLSFNAATQYKDKLYLGINLNSHFTDFRQSSRFYEDNSNTLDATDRINRLTFMNDLYTYGTGFSFQIGAIAKVSKKIRLGLAYESPIWYHLNDEFSQSLVSVSSNTSGELAPVTVNPNLTNYYEPYQLQTPGKFTGSFAYIFGKSGLLSIDYAMKDYRNTQFKPGNDSYYSSINDQMNTTLNCTGELRIGAEYRIQQWSFRGGYRFEESPYKNAKTIGDLNGYSSGLGYNFGATKVDFAYSTAKRATQQGFFAQGFTDGAKVNTTNNNFTMTLLFEL